MKNTKNQYNAFVEETLDKAQDLKESYDIIGAKRTQAIRNPWPMHELILKTLPILPALDSTVKIQCRNKIKLSNTGKQFIQLSTNEGLAMRILPNKTWQKGLTVRQIMTNLQEKGYIVNSISSIYRALSYTQWTGNVQSVKKENQQTKLYFAVKD